MAFIHLPQRWSRQPPHPVNVDWINPLTRMMTFAFFPTLRRDAVSKSRAIEYGSASYPAKQTGVVCNVNAGVGNRIGFSGILNTVIPAGSFTHSIFVLAQPAPSNSRSTFFAQGDDGASPYSQRCLLANAALGGNKSGSAEYQEWDSTSRFLVNSVDNVIDGSLKKICLVRSSATTGSIYFNGLDRTEVVTGNSYSTITSGDVAVSGVYGSSRTAYNDIALVLVWSRALSADEVRELSKTPWQIFKPASRVLYFPVSSGGYTLVVASANHSHAADSAPLTQAHLLALSETRHAQTVDSVSLIQANLLALSDARHNQSADAPSLTSATLLIVADAAHGQTADSPNPIQAHMLAVSDTSQAQIADPITLNTELTLSLADTRHAHAADPLALIQSHLLAVSGALHSQQADAPNVGQAQTLELDSTAHGQSADGLLSLAQIILLAVSDARHAQSADSPALSSHVTLIVSDTLHAQLADAAVESAITPCGRVFIVASENRTFLVAASSRTFGVGKTCLH